MIMGYNYHGWQSRQIHNQTDKADTKGCVQKGDLVNNIVLDPEGD